MNQRTSCKDNGCIFPVDIPITADDLKALGFDSKASTDNYHFHCEPRNDISPLTEEDWRTWSGTRKIEGGNYK